jgi:hypothetical protein
MKHSLYMVLMVMVAACGGNVEVSTPPTIPTCTQVGSSYTYGKGVSYRYECDQDPGQGCEKNSKGEFECWAPLTGVNLVCPES